MWDLWWTKCHYDRILSNYFGFILSIPFFHPPYAFICYRRYIILSTDSVIKQNTNKNNKEMNINYRHMLLQGRALINSNYDAK